MLVCDVVVMWSVELCPEDRRAMLKQARGREPVIHHGDSEPALLDRLGSLWQWLAATDDVTAVS